MRNIKLIALDLDGTLLNMEKKVPQGNYQALKECEKAGIQIVPATGRALLLGDFHVGGNFFDLRLVDLAADLRA